MEEVNTVYYYKNTKEARMYLYDAQGLSFVLKYENFDLEDAEKLAVKFSAILIEE